MASIINYFHGLFKTPITKYDEDIIIILESPKSLITADDLNKVHLKKPKIIKFNNEKINIQDLNKHQLNDILNVKLKPTVKNKPQRYEIRHPVLKELQEKTIFIE